MKNQSIELQNLLKEELQKDNPDNDKIIQLTQQLTVLDQDKIRFSIDAGVIDRLGRELVARQETAVSELIKNAYDADASEVTLTFEESDKVGGTLSIVDDGDGMTRDELVNGFMRISSTGKIHNPRSRTYNRIRAGRKGIGRFAVQRLGEKLSIITQTKESEEALLLTINWNDYKQDIDLTSVSNDLKTIPKRKDKGTQLIISNLRDRWTLGTIKRIFPSISDTMQPYSLSNERKMHESERSELKGDPGFKTSFFKANTPNGNIIKIADETTEIFKHSLATFEGYIDDNGHGIYSIESSKLDFEETGLIGLDPDDNKTPFHKLNKIHFRAYYFIIDTEFIPKTYITHIRRFLRDKGSIRLYRNGFRVLPYGEPTNDWLSLDQSTRTRTILPQHSNINFYGLVEMTDEEETFKETSSREGLVDSEELGQLRNFIYRTLLTGVVKIAEKRNVKITTGQEQDDQGSWEKSEIRIRNIAKTIDELDREADEVTTPERKRARRKKIRKIKKEVEALEISQAEEQKKIIKERSMLRVLSSVGLSIAQFNHEIKFYMASIKSDVNELLLLSESSPKAMERLQALSNNFSTFRTYTSYFDHIVSQNVVKELEPINLEQIVDRFVNSIDSEAKRSSIVFVKGDYPPYRVFTKPMHPSEWSSILFNFYTNSKKAIARANAQGKIMIEIGEEEKMAYLEFSDNGDGIAEEIEDRIFDDFFTTTSPSNYNDIDHNTEFLGTGLGLKIVKDIIKGYRGVIQVVSPKEDYCTTIRVEIPKATDKEYEEYGL